MSPPFQWFVFPNAMFGISHLPFTSLLHHQMESLEYDLLVSLAMLRRHINFQKSPIYCLHLELLPEVVSHLERDSDLVSATQVSYHWRNVLHAHPSLWAHLDFGNTGGHLNFSKGRNRRHFTFSYSATVKPPPRLSPCSCMRHV